MRISKAALCRQCERNEETIKVIVAVNDKSFIINSVPSTRKVECFCHTSHHPPCGSAHLLTGIVSKGKRLKDDGQEGACGASSCD
jgi:hypothetical protein